jgi:hypothetical protein
MNIDRSSEENLNFQTVIKFFYSFIYVYNIKILL